MATGGKSIFYPFQTNGLFAVDQMGVVTLNRRQLDFDVTPSYTVVITATVSSSRAQTIIISPRLQRTNYNIYPSHSFTIAIVLGLLYSIA